MCFVPQLRALFRHLNFQKWSEREVFFFSLFAYKCASRRNSVHFFDISTSKSGPNVRCFFLSLFAYKCASRCNSVHFFDISTSKSGPNVRFFLACLLTNVPRAATACTFSTSQLPKVVRTCGVFGFLLTNVLRATTVCNFHLSSGRWLRTRCFSEPTFRPSRATNHWKTTVNRDFPTFSRTGIFFLLTLSLLWFLSLLFFSSLALPTSAFPSVHTVGSLISKLPSIIGIVS